MTSDGSDWVLGLMFLAGMIVMFVGATAGERIKFSMRRAVVGFIAALTGIAGCTIIGASIPSLILLIVSTLVGLLAIVAGIGAYTRKQDEKQDED